MHIGQFGESFLPIVDGVSRVMKAYADTLSYRGHEVYVITPMDNSGYRGQYQFEIVDYASVKMPKFIPYRVGHAKFDPHFTARINQISLDICHAHGPAFAGKYAVEYAKKHNLPIIGTFHTKFYDDILKITHSKTLATIGAKVVANFYESCDETWAVSEYSAETLREYGYKGDIVIMPNGTNKRNLNIARVQETSAKYKIDNEKVKLLYVGQMNFKKNIRRIIESCAELKHQNIDFQMIFAGKGPDEEAIKKLVDRYNLTKETVFTGHLADIEVLDCVYYLSDLLVFPSVYDTAGLVLSEAAAMHTPSLVVKQSGPSERIENMKNGIVVENTTTSVTDGILSYIKLPEAEKKIIIDNAYETIPLPWNGELMDTIEGRYQNLIDMYKYFGTRRIKK